MSIRIAKQCTEDYIDGMSIASDASRRDRVRMEFVS